MQAHAADEGVFIRSMATRGHLGGLARATGDAALVLDAAGKDVIIIETVGVGQDEVDIIRTADVSIVTLVPGTGDEVQALKAGIMEIADIFVVNKADREGADRLVVGGRSEPRAADLRAAGEWRPPIVKTVATTGTRRARAGRRRSRSSARTRPAHAGGAAQDAQRVPPARAGVASLHGSSRARGARAGRARIDRRSHRRARARSVHRGERSAERALKPASPIKPDQLRLPITR